MNSDEEAECERYIDAELLENHETRVHSLLDRDERARRLQRLRAPHLRRKMVHQQPAMPWEVYLMKINIAKIKTNKFLHIILFKIFSLLNNFLIN
jgi:hypothetical protein